MGRSRRAGAPGTLGLPGRQRRPERQGRGRGGAIGRRPGRGRGRRLLPARLRSSGPGAGEAAAVSCKKRNPTVAGGSGAQAERVPFLGERAREQ